MAAADSTPGPGTPLRGSTQIPGAAASPFLSREQVRWLIGLDAEPFFFFIREVTLLGTTSIL